VLLVAVTAPGRDRLPWDPDHCAELGAHRHGGELGCRVVRDLADEWNETASDRYATMWKAATMAADRVVRRAGWRGPLPRRVAVAWSAQRRGVWHTHEALPGATEVERAWSRVVVEYVHRTAARYGWGYVDRNPLRHLGAMEVGNERAARYLARNAAAYLGTNASAIEERAMPGRRQRSYVSRRLTTQTGVTIRNLRRVRHLWVVLTFGYVLPTWPTSELELVWSLLLGNEHVPRGPPIAPAAGAA
jgi:hypothetical protein